MSTNPKIELGQGREELLPFDFPVSLAFADDGTMYVSERLSGRLFEVRDGSRRLVHEFRVPHLEMHSETGQIGLALDPDFANNRSIYVYHTVQEFEDPWHNRISRVNVDSGEEEVIANLPAGQLHNGGIMAFGPDGKLYVGIGEFMKPPLAQVKDYPAGKVLRMNRDGSIPDDNPFPGSYTYSYGHRNIFGLAFHPTTGRLYECDIGPDHDDEINIIQKGGNYGWPIVTGKARRSEFVDPIYSFKIVVTPTQCVFANERELYVGSFNFGEVYRLTLGGPDFSQVVKHEIVYADRPFGTIGTFISPRGDFFITRPEGVVRVRLQPPQPYDRAVE
ncbi:MAG: PQQ-dependent sugar dehydrogenase [Chloroflexota bacterium]